MLSTPDFTTITPSAEIRTSTHGNRAKCLQRLMRLGLPVPRTVALRFDTVRAIAAGRLPDMRALLGVFGDGALLSVRSSSLMADWGGPGTILNIGMTDEKAAALARAHGQSAADALYCSFIRAYPPAVDVLRLDADGFEGRSPAAGQGGLRGGDGGASFRKIPPNNWLRCCRSMSGAAPA